ncbi:phage major capsid protein [Micrococcus antarcticus]|uniref:phage major capsid protein n=1 Tax=Micrococcus antarcticus TaxID=86171 RepID=UPI00385008C4
MPTYNAQVTRANVPVPEDVSRDIIAAAPASSLALSTFRHVPMSTKTSKQPVLSALPSAFWVNGDTGLKQTTEAAWSNVIMTAEEVAALVPIPDALVDDTDIPLWDSIKPYLVEAVGRTVDDAAVWGVNKPASWTSPALVPGAIAAGNTVAAGSGKDLGADIAALAGKVAADGYAVDTFAGGAGYDWKLAGLRTTSGNPLFIGPTDPNLPGTIYGRPLREVRNGTFNATAAELLAYESDKFVVGVRQDITFDLFDQMVISDDTGKVIFNAPQQDSKVLRVVFRVGYAVANPVSRTSGDAATRFPAGVLTPAAA